MTLDIPHHCNDAVLVHGAMRYAVVKRSVMVGGHKTSVSLEDAFWDSLRDIATRGGITLSMQLARIDQQRKTDNLSSAIRLFVLDYFRTRATSMMLIGERQMGAPNLVPLPVETTSRAAAKPPVVA